MIELCVNYLTVLKKMLTFYGKVLLSGNKPQFKLLPCPIFNF